jgi:hypothetical protein
LLVLRATSAVEVQPTGQHKICPGLRATGSSAR